MRVAEHRYDHPRTLDRDARGAGESPGVPLCATARSAAARLSRAGDAAGTARAYERAITLTANAVERAKPEGRRGAPQIN